MKNDHDADDIGRKKGYVKGKTKTISKVGEAKRARGKLPLKDRLYGKK